MTSARKAALLRFLALFLFASLYNKAQFNWQFVFGTLALIELIIATAPFLDEKK